MTQRLIQTLFTLLTFIPRWASKAIASVVFIVIILFTHNAFAQNLYECIQVRDSNRVVDGEKYTVVTFGNQTGCDLYLAARMYPQRDAQGNALPIQAQLRSIYAANRGRMINGLRTASTVRRGCIPHAKPWSDQTLEEKEFCPGLVNYFPIPRNGHYSEVFIPHRPQQTITEKLVGLSETTCRSLAARPNPSTEVRGLLASCQKYFEGITIPKPTITKEQLQIQQSNETIAMQQDTIDVKNAAIASLTPLANDRLKFQRYMWWALAFGLVFGVGGTGLAGLSYSRQRRMYSLAFLRKEELDSQVRKIRDDTEGRIAKLEAIAEQKESLEKQFKELQSEHNKLKTLKDKAQTSLEEAQAKLAAIGDRLIDFWFSLTDVEDTPRSREQFEKLDHASKSDKIKSHVQKLQLQMQDWHSKTMAAETRAQGMQNRIDHVSQQLKEAQTSYTSLQQRAEELASIIEKERETASAQLVQMRQRGDRALANNQVLQQQYQDKCAELEVEQQAAQALQAQLEQASASINQLNADIVLHREQYETANKRVEEVRTQLTTSQQEYSTLQAVFERAQKNHAQVEKQLTHAQQRIQQLEQAVAEKHASNEELAKAVDTIQTLEQTRDQLRIALKSSQDELVTLEASLQQEIDRLKMNLDESQAETACMVDLRDKAVTEAKELEQQLQIANSALEDSQSSNERLRSELDVVRADMKKFEDRIAQLRKEKQELQRQVRKIHEQFIAPSRAIPTVNSETSEPVQATVKKATLQGIPVPSITVGKFPSAEGITDEPIQAAVEPDMQEPDPVVDRRSEDEGVYKVQYLQLQAALRTLLEHKRHAMMDLLTRIDGSIEKTEELQAQIQTRLATTDDLERPELEKKSVSVDRALRLQKEQHKDVELRLDRLPSVQGFDEDYDKVLYFVSDALVPETREERDRFAKLMAWDVLVADMSTQITDQSLRKEYEKSIAQLHKLQKEHAELETAYYELAGTIIEIHDLEEKGFREKEYPEKRAFLTGPVRTIMADHRRHEQELRNLSLRLDAERTKLIKAEKDRDSFRRFCDQQAAVAETVQQDLVALREEYADFRRSVRQGLVVDGSVLEITRMSEDTSVPPAPSIPRELSQQTAMKQEMIGTIRLEDLRLMAGNDLTNLTNNCVRVISERHANGEAVEFPVASIDDVYTWNDFLHIPVVSDGYELPDVLQMVLRSKKALRLLHLTDEACERPPESAKMLRAHIETERPSAMGPYMPPPDSQRNGQAPKLEIPPLVVTDDPNPRKG